MIYSDIYKYPGPQNIKSQGYNPKYKNGNFSHHRFSRYLFAVENIFLFAVANVACCAHHLLKAFIHTRGGCWYGVDQVDGRLEGSLACDGDIMCPEGSRSTG